MTEDIEQLIVEDETEEIEEDKSKQVEYKVSSETQKKKKSFRYYFCISDIKKVPPPSGARKTPTGFHRKEPKFWTREKDLPVPSTPSPMQYVRTLKRKASTSASSAAWATFTRLATPMATGPFTSTAGHSTT